MNASDAEKFVRERVRVTRQHVAIAKKILLRSTAQRLPSSTLVQSVLAAHGASIPSHIASHQVNDLPATLAGVATALIWQRAAQEALWALIHGGFFIPSGGQWTASVGVGYSTQNLGTGLNFEDLTLPVPNEVCRAPSLGDGQEFLSDADLYLQTLNIPNMHREVQDALREAVNCFRSELYTAAVAMLGKGSEGSWIELGAALLAAADAHAPALTKQREILDDPTAGTMKKIEAVMHMFDRRDIFGEIKEASGIRSQELRLAAVWSDTVRESRNTLHFGVAPSTPNTYEKVAALLLAAPQSLRVLYRLKNTADAANKSAL